MSRRHLAVGGDRRVSRAGAALLGLGLAAAVAVTGIALGSPVARAADDAAAPVAEQAAPTGTTATTVTTGGRTLTVQVSPQRDLPPSGAQITVAGKGFDPAHDLWVAVCQDDGVAPQALVNCVGGAIPDENTTTGWAIVTDAKQSPYPGPVTTRWHKDGSFKVTLQLPSAISEAADCVSAPCSVFTRSSDDADRGEDAGVAVEFASPPGTSSSQESSGGAGSSGASSSESTPTSTSSSAEPTTRTYGEVPTTVTPDSMLQTSVVAGEPQTIVFAGFRPGEKVDVTLYSDPVTLPAVTADPAGNVRVSFTVPKDLPPGEHLLQAIGTESGRVGIARFTVTAPSSSVSASPSTVSASASAPATATSSAAAPVVPPAGSSSVAVSSSSPSPASATATASSSSVAAAGGGNRLLWLWIVLAVLIVVGGAAGIVAMVRSRREDDDVPVTQAAVAPPEPGWSAGPGAGPTLAGGPAGRAVPGLGAPPVDPGGGFGLLSGREHPDGPALYSGGGWPEQPTQAMGEQPTQAIGEQPTQAMGGPQPGPAEPDPGPSTQQWRPDFGAGDSGAGPSTQQWRPDFTGEQPRGDGDEPPSGRHGA